MVGPDLGPAPAESLIEVLLGKQEGRAEATRSLENWAEVAAADRPEEAAASADLPEEADTATINHHPQTPHVKFSEKYVQCDDSQSYI
jgi:hypothetical protein